MKLSAAVLFAAGLAMTALAGPLPSSAAVHGEDFTAHVASLTPVTARSVVEAGGESVGEDVAKREIPGHRVSSLLSTRSGAVAAVEATGARRATRSRRATVFLAIAGAGAAVGAAGMAIYEMRVGRLSRRRSTGRAEPWRDDIDGVKLGLLADAYDDEAEGDEESVPQRGAIRV